MNNLLLDKTGNYISTGTCSLETLETFGIAKSVKEKSQTLVTKLIDGLPLDLEDINIILNLYVGTIMNHSLSEETLLQNCVEIELPEILAQVIHEGSGPIICWKGLYFHTYITKYNQIVLSYMPEDIPQYYWHCEIVIE